VSTEPVVGARPGRDLVFVSYARDDAEWMQAFRVMLAPVLAGLGYELWADTGLRTGEDWDPQIEAAIARSEVALLLVSPRFLFSEYVVRRELPLLREHGVRLAPILVGTCAPELVLPELTAVQWLHDTGRDGALNLVEQVGERDRRIWRACDALLGLLSERKQSEPQAVHQPAAAPPVAPLPEQDEPGDLSGVPPEPPGYVARAELAGLIDAVTGVDTGAVGVVGGGRAFGLHGQGGIGKSVLAAAVARDPDVRGRFPDGVFWATVGEGGDVLAAQLDLLTRLDPGAEKPRTPAQAQRSLRDALAERRVLLVVDDVWSDAAARAFRLTGPLGRVLYTTRDERVLDAVGAEPFRVEVLSPAAARGLARAVLTADPDAAAEVDLPPAADTAIEQVGRVALAVALLAAAVRGGRTWAQVAADLVRDADVFGDHPYANTFKAMQIGVGALPDDLAAALLGLAVFAPDSRTPVTAIARYWSHTRGSTTVETLADLRALAAANTLTVGEDGVEFHDLQHEYLMLHAGALSELHSALLDAYRGTLSARDQWWQLDPAEPYLRDHLAAHLRAVGARRELATTLTDPAFLVHRLAVAGVLVTENDLADAAGALPDHQVLGWWRAWLPRHAHVLALPAEPTGPAERIRMLAPTLRAWLAADPTRPATVDPARLRPVTAVAHLTVEHGLATPAAAQIRVLTGHTAEAYAVDWAPDGTRLASAGADGTVRIWDPGSGAVVATLTEHADEVGAVAWSPDGTTVASTARDGAVRIWNPATGHVRTLREHAGPANALAWSPDGARLVTADSAGSVLVWDAATGETTGRFDNDDRQVNAVAWAPAGDGVAIGGVDGTVRIWNPATGHVRTLTGHRGAVDAVAWAPDGTRLASAGHDTTVRVWDLTAGYLTRAEHASPVTAVAWSPDGTLLASTDTDGTVRIWDPTAKVVTHTFTGHGDWARAVTWSPDGARLASASDDLTVRIWDATAEGAVRTRVEHGKAPDVVAWSSGGTRLAADGPDNTVRVWNPATRRTRRLTGHTDVVYAVAWSPDETELASAGADGTVRIWTAAGDGRTLAGHRGAVNAVAWSPHGTRVASAGNDNTVRIWDPGTGQTVHTLAQRSEWPQVVAWSPDGSRLAIGGADGTVSLWDPTTGRRTRTLAGHSAWINALSWSPGGTHLASGSSDHTARIWDLRPAPGQRWYRRSRRLDPDAVLRAGEFVYEVRWSADGRHLVTMGQRTVRLWDARTADPVATLRDPSETPKDVVGSPDGTHLAVAWFDGRITVHDSADLAEVGRLHLGTSARVDWAAPGIAAATAGGIVLLTWGGF
jgi:WD40 repeat protein